MIEFGKNFTLKNLNLPENAFPFEMLWVEPGEFQMGSNAPEIEYMYMHTPVIYSFRNIVSKGFWLGQFVVTHAHWKALGNLPLTTKENDEKLSEKPDLWIDKKNLPMYWCIWPEAMLFCRELNIKYKNYLPEGYHFSLPMETHWEYCCKAGLAADYKELDKNKYGYMTHPEYIKEITLNQPNEPNPWGFYEMLGNVSEMCFDIPNEYPYEDLIEEYKFPMIGDKFIDWGSEKVIRFSVGDRVARGMISSTYRYTVYEDQRFLETPLAFRVALRPITKMDIEDEWIKRNNINMLGD